MFLNKRGNIWYIWYEDPVTGKRKKISTGCDKKSDAIGRLHEFIAKQASHENDSVMPKAPLVSAFKTELIAYLEPLMSSGTVIIYKRSFNDLLSVLGDMPLDAVSHRHTDIFKSKRLGQVSPTTVNIDLRTLKAAFNIAVRWEYLKSNPFARIKYASLPETIPAFFTREHLGTFINSIEEEWFKQIIIFTVMTGLRRSEVANLRWCDVDSTMDHVSICSSANFKTKSGKRRIVPLNPVAKTVLQKQSERTYSEYIFTYKGKRIVPNFITHKFKDLLRKLGIDKEEIHFHSLRHTFASWLVQNGVSIYAVKELLGHADVKTTQIYSHLAGSDLHDEVGKISGKI